MTAVLPKYQNPPVNEVAIGVQFQPVAGWSIVSLGQLRERFADELPKAEAKPTIDEPADNFDNMPRRPSFTLQPIQTPEARCWYISEDGHRLVQVQHDRFIFNWRKLDTDQKYPGYEEYVRPQFQTFWERYCDFLSSESLEFPRIVQCETTYVNRIKRGEGWSSVDDWCDVFTVLRRNNTAEFLPPIETDQFSRSYLLSDPVGRLRIRCNLVVTQSDGSQAINLTLVARNKPESSASIDILHSLDTARAWVVKGFTDITTPAMHKKWGRLS